MIFYVLVISCILSVFAKRHDYDADDDDAADVEGCIKSSQWTSSSYIDLNCPLSPCVSLQWTIRDSCVVNLPCTLLVEGDVILLRPGQIVSVKCRRLKVCILSAALALAFFTVMLTRTVGLGQDQGLDYRDHDQRLQILA